MKTRRWLEPSFWVLLLCCSIYISGAAARSQDLVVTDEVSYSLIGYLWPDIDLVSNWSPLYSLWQAFLFHFEANRVDHYHLNAQILSGALPTIFYLALRCVGFGVQGALAGALFFLTLRENMVSLNRVNVFASIVLCISIVIVRFADKETRSPLLAPLLLLILSYARPEFFLGFIVHAFLTLWYLLRSPLRRPVTALALIAISVGCITFCGFPLHDPAYERDVEVFGQINAKYGTRDGTAEVSQWRELLTKEWGGEISTIKAFIKRPQDVLMLHAKKMLDLPQVTWEALRSVFTPPNSPLPSEIIALMFQILLVAVMLTSAREAIVINDSGMRTFVVIASLSALLPLLINFPHHRYIVQALCALSLLLPFAARSIPRIWSPAEGTAFERITHRQTALMLLLVLTITGVIGIGHSHYFDHRNQAISLVKSVSQIPASSLDGVFTCPTRLKGWLPREHYRKTKVSCAMVTDTNSAILIAYNGQFTERCRCGQNVLELLKSTNVETLKMRHFEWGVLARR